MRALGVSGGTTDDIRRFPSSSPGMPTTTPGGGRRDGRPPPPGAVVVAGRTERRRRDGGVGARSPADHRRGTAGRRERLCKDTWMVEDFWVQRGGLAQLAERLLSMQEVRGLIPLFSRAPMV